MKAHENPEPAVRLARTWMLVLAALCAAPAVAGPLQQAPAGGDAEPRVVSADARPCLGVRSQPSYRAPVIDCLEIGSRVAVVADSGEWSLLASDGDIGGWVSGRLLVTAEAAAAEEVAASDEPSVELPEPAAVAAESAGEASEPADAEAETPAEASEPVAVAAEPAAPEAGPEDAVMGDPVVRELVGAAARIEALRGELAAVRADREAAAAEASALGEQVRRLTEERDDLARQLARAEARVLYLVSDLERTRAELMRLKGIPPRLVRPEPEPGPAEVRPEPEPEPAEAAEPNLFEPPVAPNFMVIEEVVGTVRAWAQSWADQRADDYLAFYSASFTPADGTSREAWAAQRRERIAAPRSIEITLDRINPIIQGDRASVRFVQGYASDTFSDTVDKTLVLERVGDAIWQIVEERVE